ncbi:MAG: acetylxylan esterase [Spirochaetales bacterium]|nr:acetylxylan esterase [Spirochaetales bacterium]
MSANRWQKPGQYPSPAQVDRWVEELWQRAAANPYGAEVVENGPEWPTQQGYPFQYGVRHNQGTCYVRFTPARGEAFYGFWQPSFRQPAPLLVHTPGYGAELSAHPEIVAQGYNVLHVNPLGYCTPEGINPARSRDPGDPLGWPQLPDTIASGGARGYREWFVNALQAVEWAVGRREVAPGRLSFFGTSQGGGAALILASLYRDRGVRCAGADEPFLTNFAAAAGRGAYGFAAAALDGAADPDAAWRALGFVDTLSHAHRLDLPVLLTAGGADEMCPAELVEALFDELPGVKSLVYLKNSEHGYTPEFLVLLQAWLTLYA